MREVVDLAYRFINYGPNEEHLTRERVTRLA